MGFSLISSNSSYEMIIKDHSIYLTILTIKFYNIHFFTLKYNAMIRIYYSLGIWIKVRKEKYQDR